MITQQYSYFFDFKLLTVNLTISEFNIPTAKFLVEYTINVGDRTLSDIKLESRGYFNDFNDLLYQLITILDPDLYSNYRFVNLPSVIDNLNTVRSVLLALPDYRSDSTQVLNAYYEIVGMFRALVDRLSIDI